MPAKKILNLPKEEEMEEEVDELEAIFGNLGLTKQKFLKGATFQNILNTTPSKPQTADKDRVHKRRSSCVFCNNGNYDGLNHVVERDVQCELGEKVKAWLAPGCTACNKTYDNLVLKRDTNFYQEKRYTQQNVFLFYSRK